MKLVKNIYRDMLSVFNYPFIPKELMKKLKGPILLHISDTPVNIYSYIFRIIDIIKPEFIIHTGDMADDIKLGNSERKIHIYSCEVAKLIEGLEKNEHSKVYYVLGNHDDYETVRRLTKRGIIIKDEVINIHGYKFAISHYYKEYLDKVDFNLYGHSFYPRHYKNKEIIGLNGVLNINIIDLSTKNIFHLDYPMGTNRLRLMEPRKFSL